MSYLMDEIEKTDMKEYMRLCRVKARILSLFEKKKKIKLNEMCKLLKLDKKDISFVVRDLIYDNKISVLIKFINYDNFCIYCFLIWRFKEMVTWETHKNRK